MYMYVCLMLEPRPLLLAEYSDVTPLSEIATNSILLYKHVSMLEVHYLEYHTLLNGH